MRNSQIEINLPETTNTIEKNNNDKYTKAKDDTTDDKNQKSKNRITDMLFANTPQNEVMNVETNNANRTLQLENQIVIVNKIITTPVTFERIHIHGR